jgi:hypothetical protein
MAPETQPTSDAYARAQRLLALAAQLRQAGVVCTNSGGMSYWPAGTSEPGRPGGARNDVAPPVVPADPA